MNMLDKQFWQRKKVFLTGHTGFKGSWLCLWLSQLGAVVKGYALAPPSQPNLFEEAFVERRVLSEIGDIRDQEQVSASIGAFSPDILIHLAAQPLVRKSYQDPIETYDTNVLGTAKVLEAARDCPKLQAIVNVTSDKCYENQAIQSSQDAAATTATIGGGGFCEGDRLGGKDPYSSSKACAELVTIAYRTSFLEKQGIGLASARAGNVIGGGDWAQDRLLPDILRAKDRGESVKIRNPESTRPWQHVLDSLFGYLLLAQYLYKEPKKYASAWNFGPEEGCERSVKWILEYLHTKWPNITWLFDRESPLHEAAQLRLNPAKAITRLGWHSALPLEQALDRTVQWHEYWRNKEDMQQTCLAEIADFCEGRMLIASK